MNSTAPSSAGTALQKTTGGNNTSSAAAREQTVKRRLVCDFQYVVAEVGTQHRGVDRPRGFVKEIIIEQLIIIITIIIIIVLVIVRIKTSTID